MHIDLRSLLERVHGFLYAFHLWLGLGVFLFVACAILATATDWPTGRLLTDMAVWAGATGALGAGLWWLARRMRAATFGDLPPAEPVTRQDLAGHAVCLLAGPLLLYWFLPRVVEVRPTSWAELVTEAQSRWVDALLVAVGAWLIGRVASALFDYITRR